MINYYGYVYCITVAVAVCVSCIIRVVDSSLDVSLAIIEYALLVVTTELTRATDIFELTIGGAGVRADALDWRALLGRTKFSIVSPRRID